jgi:hypothetical protein
VFVLKFGAFLFLLPVRKEIAVTTMPKHECSSVLGHAPRKALAVKKAIKKGSAKAKTQKKHVKIAVVTAAPMASSPQEREIVSADEHVSASPTPPTPSSPRSPTYMRESWWDSFSALSRRISDASAAIDALKVQVQRLEEERQDASLLGK